MGEAVLSTLVAKVLESLAMSAYKEAASWWAARNGLKKLEMTMKMIQARVCDAERRQEEERNDLLRLWLGRLRRVLYRADDLFDEVLTLDRQKQRMKGCTLEKVGIVISRSNPLCYSIKLAHEIKSIRKELKAIKLDMDVLNLRVLLVEDIQYPTDRLIKKRETASFVQAEDVIGRENDIKMILDMVFDPKCDREKVTVIPIVGFGGLGKTTLAQYVYNDDSVQKNFGLVKWACVPEIGNQRAVLDKVYKSFTRMNSSDLSLDDVKSGICTSINNEKYLLVLDDVWDEDRSRWVDLLRLLECGKSGSIVIVTTRSDVVAKIIGTVLKPFKLGVLAKEDSWNLFRRLAFKPGQEESNPSLTQIGKEIVDRCGNVPLAIKVVGSLLYSEDSEEKWQLLKDNQFSKAKLVEDGDIMPVLKLSYDYLLSPLKQCFVYCSVFPKDYEFNKADLVHLWMAQGYFEPSNRDIGGMYFMELLGRNFFQDPQEDERGDVKMCKMHDLVHDLSQRIAGDECIILGESSLNISDRLVHVNMNGEEAQSSLLVARKIRSLLGLFDSRHANLKYLFSKFRSLRVLSLENRGINTLPGSIRKLTHLRYLNLAGNHIACLPDAITTLENLQTLNLDDCKSLGKLPPFFTRLTNLRHLVVDWDSLTELPSDFGKMTSLHELHRFEVGKVKGSGIDSLPALNLRGELVITFHKWRRNALMEAQKANLKCNQQLKFLLLEFRLEEEEASCASCEMDTCASCEMDTMLTHLQLPPNLKYLEFGGYIGDKMPSRWLEGLSNLVSISIVRCNSCRVLLHFGQLPLLKFLYIKDLETLEYIEDEAGGNSGPVVQNGYFPSLEVLELVDLPQLKGWRRSSNKNDERRQLFLPSLLQMKVNGCYNLMSMPSTPNLELLDVRRINGKLLKSNLTLLTDQKAPSTSSPSSASTLFMSLKQLKIYQIPQELVSLSISSRLCNLHTIEISFCYQLRSILFESPNSIRNLQIYECRSLRSISEGLQHLSVLEKLEIRRCEELREEEGEEGKTTCKSWKALRNLRSLQLLELPKLKMLPQGIACLTALERLTLSRLNNLTALPEEIDNLSELRELRIINCPKLASLPPSIQGLCSLQMLYIGGCSGIAERCKRPNGEDYHLIQHILHVDIED